MPRNHDHRNHQKHKIDDSGHHEAKKPVVLRSDVQVRADAKQSSHDREPSRWERVKKYFVNDDGDDKQSREDSRSVGKAHEGKQVVEPKRDDDREERMAKAKHAAGGVRFGLPSYDGGDAKQHIVKCAEKFLGERELGKNTGPLPDYVNAKAGAPKGSYWCASFASHVISDTGLVSRTAGSMDLKSKFAANGAFNTRFNDIEPGDLAFFTRGKDGGHVGVVKNVLRNSDGKVTGFVSIEGNSGDRVREVYHSLNDKKFLGTGDLDQLAKNRGVDLERNLANNSHDRSHSSTAKMLASEPSRSSNSRAPS